MESDKFYAANTNGIGSSKDESNNVMDTNQESNTKTQEDVPENLEKLETYQTPLGQELLMTQQYVNNIPDLISSNVIKLLVPLNERIETMFKLLNDYNKLKLDSDIAFKKLEDVKKEAHESEERYESTIETLKEQISIYEKENTELKKSLEAKNEEITNYSGKCIELEKELEDAKTEIRNYKNELETLKEELDQKTHPSSTLECEKCSVYKSDILRMEETLRNMEDEVRNSVAGKEASEKELEKIKCKNKERKQEIKTLEKKIEDQDKELKKLKLEIDEKSRLIEDYKKMKSDHSSEVESLKEIIKNKDKNITKLEEKLEESAKKSPGLGRNRMFGFSGSD